MNSEFLRKRVAQYFSDGVFYNPADALQVTVDTGMNVKVLPGVCHIQGAMGDRGQPACWRSGKRRAGPDRHGGGTAGPVAGGARIDLYVLKGTPGETPTAPALTPTTRCGSWGWRICLWRRTPPVSRSSASPIAGLDTARCGQVIAPAAPADLEPYFAQLQAAIAAHDTAAMEQIAELGRVMTEAGQPYGGIMTYTHARTGTMHELTGSGNDIKFAASAAFEEGDSVTVTGTPARPGPLPGTRCGAAFGPRGGGDRLAERKPGTP